MMTPRAIELLIAGAAHGAPTVDSARAEVRAALVNAGLHDAHACALAELVLMRGTALACPSMADVVRVMGGPFEVHEQAALRLAHFLRCESAAQKKVGTLDRRRDGTELRTELLRRALLALDSMLSTPSHPSWERLPEVVGLLEVGAIRRRRGKPPPTL